MLTMYPGMVNSPITELAAAIDDVQTTITVVDGTKLPDAPNLAIIGRGEDAETILYTEKTGNVLSGVVRGFQGVAKAWGQGARIARFFTEYDQRAMMQNIQENADNLAAHLNEIATNNKLGHVIVGSGLHVDQNGVLSLEQVYFYDKGTEHVSWVASTTGTTQKEETHLFIKSVGGSATLPERQAFFETETLIDFSQISFLYAEIIMDANYYNNDTSFVILDGSNIIATKTIYTGEVTNRRIINSLDVRTLSGQYKLRIHARIASSNNSDYNQVKIVSVWGER